jgi:hypothetical protein
MVAMGVNAQLDPSHGMFLIDKLIQVLLAVIIPKPPAFVRFRRHFIWLIYKSMLVASLAYVIGF